ncbi:MAG TPA: hypothetical protein VGW39_00955 [Chthoniobacterales bacterium]|nr:hypothetical protein [Chthoniobacterales bacterium]
MEKVQAGAVEKIGWSIAFEPPGCVIFGAVRHGRRLPEAEIRSRISICVRWRAVEFDLHPPKKRDQALPTAPELAEFFDSDPVVIDQVQEAVPVNLPECPFVYEAFCQHDLAMFEQAHVRFDL